MYAAIEKNEDDDIVQKILVFCVVSGVGSLILQK